MNITAHKDVQEYYGKVLKSKQDLQTSACCVGEAVPAHLTTILRDIHPEITERFYGCGSPIPAILEGKTVLDLGCGSGRDCYLLSRLVGPQGKVIGIDMTDEQLKLAAKHVDFHTKKYGYINPNVIFHKGYIEDLSAADIKNESVDVVVSNCVINLSPNKETVFSEILRVLKPGGEMYFSDVFSDRKIPKQLMQDPLLLGECLSGAMYFEDFRRMLSILGCYDYRIVSQSTLDITNPVVEQKIGMINFYSTTIRAFKLDLEDRCEDYGQLVTYKGTIEHLKERLNIHNIVMPWMHNISSLLESPLQYVAILPT